MIELYRNKNNRKMAKVVCTLCGKEKSIYEENLDSPKHTSCICKLIKHGDNRTKLYSVYANMKYRCYNKNMHEYKNYGGKGVKMCDDWLGEDGYIHFKEWALNNGYKKGLTIDRIDSEGNYEPNNCQWISRSKNTVKANKTSQHRHANNGIYYCLDKDNNEYIEFENANKFARDHNLNANSIRAAANGNREYGGYLFGFKKDLINKEVV